MNLRDVGLEKDAPASAAVLSPPDVVVQDYLDFMLRSVTEEVVVAPAIASVMAPVGASPARESVNEESSPSRARPAPAVIVSTEVTVSRARPAPTLDVSAEPAPAVVLQPRAENGRPLWAQSPFECLLFQVLGLKLAAPLIALGGIARINDDLTPIFGQSDWFLGLLRWNGRNIRVVDTARLIMPERLPPSTEGQRPAYEFVLLIEGTDWGLAMDSATESLHMTPDEVRWRINAQTRPWLAGTVLQKMCALLDMNAIAGLLHVKES